MSKNTGTSELINYFDLGVNGDVGIAGSLDINTIANATTDTDTFLVSDTGIIKYRTGAQLLSDIGAAPAVAGGYVPYTGATTNVDLGVYNLTASAIIANGSGSNSGIVHLESNAIHSLVNGYGSIASGTTNQFNLYQTTGAGVFRGAILSLNSITEFATRTFTLPDADGTIALTSNIPANAVGGTGTTNYLPKFTGASTIGNSIVYDDGAVGIGTLSATAINNASGIANLVVGNGGSSPQGITIYTNSSTYGGLNFADATTGGGAYAGYIKFDHTNDSMGFFIGNTPRVTISSSGNLGLGVTPSAWSVIQAMQVLNTSWGASPNNLILYQSSNVFFDGAFKYITTGTASQYRINDNGVFSWLQAPSGTAGNAISFTQAMTLFSTGNLLVGTGSDTGERLQVSGNIKTNSGYIQIVNATNPSLYINNTAVQWQYYLKSNYNLAFSDAVRDVLTLGYNGSPSFFQGSNVGIGTISPNYGLEVRRSGGAWSTSDDTFGAALGVYYNTANVGSTQNRFRILADQNAVYLDGYDAFPLVFRNNGNTERMRITSGGNTVLGGNAGSGWSTAGGRTTLEIYGSIYPTALHNSSSVGNSLSYNTYWDGANWRFVQGGTSVIYIQDSEGHKFLHNSSGTAGASFTPTERMRITSGGNVLIGTQSDNGYRLRVEAQGGGSLIWFSRGSANAQCFLSVDNSFYITTGNNVGVALLNGATSWSSFSDIRLKNVTGKIENALININSLNSIKYTLKNDLEKKQRVGLIAQEVQKILPESVDEDENGMLSIRYTELIPLIVKAIQELNEKINK